MMQELTELQKVIKQSLVVFRTDSCGVNVASVCNITGDDEDTRVTIKNELLSNLFKNIPNTHKANELEYFYNKEFLTYQQLKGMV